MAAANGANVFPAILLRVPCVHDLHLLVMKLSQPLAYHEEIGFDLQFQRNRGELGRLARNRLASGFPIVNPTLINLRVRSIEVLQRHESEVNVSMGFRAVHTMILFEGRFQPLRAISQFCPERY